MHKAKYGMTLFLVFLAFLLSSGNTNKPLSRSWVKFLDQRGWIHNYYKIIQTSDEKYLLGGDCRQYSGGQNYFCFQTIDGNGEFLFTEEVKIPKNSSEERIVTLFETTDNNLLIIIFELIQYRDKKLKLTKIDREGKLIWTKVYDESDLNFIVVDAHEDQVWLKFFKLILANGGGERKTLALSPEGGYLKAINKLALTGWEDIYVTKYDTNDKLCWENKYGADKDDVVTAITRGIDGGYVLAGYTESFKMGLADNIYIFKIDERGKVLWSRTYGGFSDDQALDIVSVKDGYLVTGFSRFYNKGFTGWLGYLFGFGGHNSVGILLKLNSKGDIIWQKGYENGYCSHIFADNDENYILACSHHNGEYKMKKYSLPVYYLGKIDIIMKVDDKGNIKE